MNSLIVENFKEKWFPHFEFEGEDNRKLVRYPGKGIFKFLDKHTNLFHKNNYLPNWRYKS